MIEHDDFVKIYKSCDSEFYKLAFLTFYLYGLRLGELLGLKVDAFDFDNKMFEIYQEVNFKTGLGHYVIVSPKTASSKRFYVMPDEYILMLQKHINDNNLKEDNFIFFSSKNKNDPIPEQTFRRNSNNYCKKVSPSFHFHQFRKSTVTYLFDNNISLEEIKNYVGHSSSQITKDVYLKRSKERNQAILDVLNNTIKDIK